MAILLTFISITVPILMQLLYVFESFLCFKCALFLSWERLHWPLSVLFFLLSFFFFFFFCSFFFFSNFLFIYLFFSNSICSLKKKKVFPLLMNLTSPKPAVSSLWEHLFYCCKPKIHPCIGQVMQSWSAPWDIHVNINTPVLLQTDLSKQKVEVATWISCDGECRNATLLSLHSTMFSFFFSLISLTCTKYSFPFSVSTAVLQKSMGETRIHHNSFSAGFSSEESNVQNQGWLI